MEDFERLMMQQGVKPMSQTTKPAQSTPSQPRQIPQSPTINNQASSGVPSWLSGAKAREMLKNALEMLRKDAGERHVVSIIMVRQNGNTYRCPLNMSVGELIGRCEADKIRLALINGHQWTAILHPETGIATIEKDPDQSRAPV